MHVLDAHHQRVVAVVGVDRDAVALLLRPVEELGDVAQFLPGLGHVEFVAVLGLEGGLLLRVLEPVLAIGEAGGVALERNRPVLAALAGVLGIARHGGRRHDLGDLVLLEELRQLHVVPAGGAGAEPLRVADHHVVGRALGRELLERLVLEVGPGRGLDHDLGAGLLLVVLDQLLQVVGRVPLRPQDRELALRDGQLRKTSSSAAAAATLESALSMRVSLSPSRGRSPRVVGRSESGQTSAE